MRSFASRAKRGCAASASPGRKAAMRLPQAAAGTCFPKLVPRQQAPTQALFLYAPRRETVSTVAAGTEVKNSESIEKEAASTAAGYRRRPHISVVADPV